MRTRILEADRRHVWRPYTSAEDQASRDPIVVARAEGVWLEDLDGRRYIDGNGSWYVNTLGHGHPRLRAALTRQLERFAHVSLAGVTHEPAALLAEELVKVAPAGLERVFFSDDGSTALEVAVKMAVQYWRQNGAPRRTRFLALGGAYHGDTLGAVSLGAVEAFRAAFEPLLFDVLHVPVDAGSDGFERAVAGIESELVRNPDEVAAVVIEPILQGTSGMRMYAPELVRRLKLATERADTFLVADEVFTGFGRTGAMWACDHASVSPDILCTSKAFSGGMLPMAATLATARIFDGFRGGRARALLHGHSYTGNPLGAAIAREVLAIYRDERVVAQVAAKAPIVARAFERIAKLPGVRSTRTLGLVGAADLGQAGYLSDLGWRVYDEGLARGAYLRPLGDTVYIAPALTIAPNELEMLLQALEASIAAVLQT